MPYFESKEKNLVYYESYGHSGPVVILLHGLASSSRIWKHQIRFLQKSYRVLVVDFPGHGRSGWHSHYSFKQEAEVIDQLMIQCNLSKASLIAVSMGCSPALLFSAYYPEKVDKLILEGPVGGFYPWWSPVGFLHSLVFLLFPVVIKLFVVLKGYHQAAHCINGFGLRKKRSFKVLNRSEHRADFLAIRQLFWNCAYAQHTNLLEQIEAPVLLIRGSQDPFPKRFVDYIRQHLTHVAYMEVQNAHHLISLENPDYFNALVSKFLHKGLVFKK